MTSEYVTMYYGFSRWGKEKAKGVRSSQLFRLQTPWGARASGSHQGICNLYIVK